MNPARIKIPQDIDGEFPIIFSPNQPLKVPIMGKIPHFSQHWRCLAIKMASKWWRDIGGSSWVESRLGPIPGIGISRISQDLLSWFWEESPGFGIAFWGIRNRTNHRVDWLLLKNCTEPALWDLNSRNCPGVRIAFWEIGPSLVLFTTADSTVNVLEARKFEQRLRPSRWSWLPLFLSVVPTINPRC